MHSDKDDDSTTEQFPAHKSKQPPKHAANENKSENRNEEPTKQVSDTENSKAEERTDPVLPESEPSVTLTASSTSPTASPETNPIPVIPRQVSSSSLIALQHISPASPVPPVPAPKTTQKNNDSDTVAQEDNPPDDEISKSNTTCERSASTSCSDISTTASVNQYPRVESGFRKGAAFLGTKDQKNDNSYVRWIPHEAYEENQQRDMMGSVVDVVNINGLIVGVAATRGFNHFGSREHQVAKVREDAVAFSTACNHRYIIAAIADGVSGADSSSYGAQEAVKFALSAVQSQLNPSSIEMGDINWKKVFEYVCNRLGDYYLSNMRDFPSRADMAFRIGTTCEVLVVDTQRGKHGEVSFIRATLAGDGAGYILHRPKSLPEVELIGEIWKLKDADFNKVGALPEEPPEGFPHIVKPSPAKTGECIMITSDGIDEDMKKGDTKEARYLYHQLIGHSADNPITQPELLQTIQYVTDCSGDDRSIVAIWC